MEFPQILRERRLELGLSQRELASYGRVSQRQLAKYEKGESQPALAVAVRLANALGISLSQLAGMPADAVDFGGRWWAAWQTSKDGEELHTLQPVNLHHQADTITVNALERGLDVVDGGYLWSGELRLWDRRLLIGWYGATDGSSGSRGALYFVAHPHGRQLVGRWTGLSYDSDCATGHAALARDQDHAVGLLEELLADPAVPLQRHTSPGRRRRAQLPA